MQVIVNDEKLFRLSANVLSGWNAVQVNLMEDGLFTKPGKRCGWRREGETKSYTNQKITAVKNLIHMPVTVFAAVPVAD